MSFEVSTSSCNTVGEIQLLKRQVSQASVHLWGIIIGPRRTWHSILGIFWYHYKNQCIADTYFNVNVTNLNEVYKALGRLISCTLHLWK
jgi:hypothetical protein